VIRLCSDFLGSPVHLPTLQKYLHPLRLTTSKHRIPLNTTLTDLIAHCVTILGDPTQLLLVSTMDFNTLKDQVTNLTLYDLKAGVRKVQNGTSLGERVGGGVC